MGAKTKPKTPREKIDTTTAVSFEISNKTVLAKSFQEEEDALTAQPSSVLCLSLDDEELQMVDGSDMLALVAGLCLSQLSTEVGGKQIQSKQEKGLPLLSSGTDSLQMMANSILLAAAQTENKGHVWQYFSAVIKSQQGRGDTCMTVLVRPR